jgi:hypothetical protein
VGPQQNFKGLFFLGESALELVVPP